MSLSRERPTCIGALGFRRRALYSAAFTRRHPWYSWAALRRRAAGAARMVTGAGFPPDAGPLARHRAELTL